MTRYNRLGPDFPALRVLNRMFNGNDHLYTGNDNLLPDTYTLAGMPDAQVAVNHNPDELTKTICEILLHEFLLKTPRNITSRTPANRYLNAFTDRRELTSLGPQKHPIAKGYEENNVIGVCKILDPKQGTEVELYIARDMILDLVGYEGLTEVEKKAHDPARVFDARKRAPWERHVQNPRIQREKPMIQGPVTGYRSRYKEERVKTTRSDPANIRSKGRIPLDRGIHHVATTRQATTQRDTEAALGRARQSLTPWPGYRRKK